MDPRPDVPAEPRRGRSARGASAARAAGVAIALLVLLLAGLGDSSGIVTGTGVVTPAPTARSISTGADKVPDVELRRDVHDDDRAVSLSLHHTAMQARGALGSRGALLVLGLLALALLGHRARDGVRRDAFDVPVRHLVPARPPTISAMAWTSRGPPAGAL